MSVTNFSLRNPLVVSAVAVVLCIFGLFAYFSLGVAIAPKVNYPAVVVTTIYAGADPETVEANVSRPIEGSLFDWLGANGVVLQLRYPPGNLGQMQDRPRDRSLQAVREPHGSCQ